MPIEKSTLALVAELAKWRLSLAVAFSAVTGYLICDSAAGTRLTGAAISDGLTKAAVGTGLSETAIDIGLPGVAIGTGLITVAAGVFLLSAGAAALNQYTERKSDALMARTAGRPLPSGRMTPRTAARVALLLLAAGTLFLGFSGLLPLALGLTNVLIYNVVYTGLKKVTAFAIIPGAVVGAVPPLIGYTTAGGGLTDTVIILFALFMFLWQMPHFWLLLVRYGSEYEKAGIRTIYGSMSAGQINRLVLLWITGSSLLLWILTGIFMPFTVPVAVLLLVLNIAFIATFTRIINLTEAEYRSRKAYILINSFPLLIMVILIAAA